MPPLPADFIHARACKLKCEKILTRPGFYLITFLCLINTDGRKASNCNESIDNKRPNFKYRHDFTSLKNIVASGLFSVSLGFEDCG